MSSFEFTDLDFMCSYFYYYPLVLSTQMAFLNGKLKTMVSIQKFLLREKWSTNPKLPSGIVPGTLELKGRDASQ